MNSAELVDGATVGKKLVRDLRKDDNYLQEKAEGMTLFGGELWVVNDNDGAGWARMLNTGKLQASLTSLVLPTQTPLHGAFFYG